jgi:hypothetical protein
VAGGANRAAQRGEGDSHQSLDIGVRQGTASQLALYNPQILAKAIVFPKMPFRRLPLIGREALRHQPGTSPVAEQVSMWTLR